MVELKASSPTDVSTAASSGTAFNENVLIVDFKWGIDLQSYALNFRYKTGISYGVLVSISSSFPSPRWQAVVDFLEHYQSNKTG